MMVEDADPSCSDNTVYMAHIIFIAQRVDGASVLNSVSGTVMFMIMLWLCLRLTRYSLLTDYSHAIFPANSTATF